MPKNSFSRQQFAFLLSVLQRISVSFKILCIQMLFSVLYYIKSGTWEQGFPAVFLHFIYFTCIFPRPESLRLNK